MARLFSTPTPGYFSERLGLWRHSVSCGLMMDLLARELSLPDQATGFTAALLPQGSWAVLVGD